MADDFDSPWKEALDSYFEEFIALLFPSIHDQVDWTRGYESLDKEFQQIVRDAEVGRRYVDKLVKVFTREGIETWVLIHVEIQTRRDENFARRMYVYNYRVADRYDRRVASLAVLADDDPEWRPSEFKDALFGCEVALRFPIAKLQDLQAGTAALEASKNPFAKVVLAHFRAQQTQHDPGERRILKLRLVRELYEQGFSATDVRELFRIIDWFLALPEPLENLFWHDVDEIQKETKMPFITTPERVGRRAGMREGIRGMLKLRFGAPGLELMPEIEDIHEEDKLRAIMAAIETARTLDDVRSVWRSTPS